MNSLPAGHELRNPLHGVCAGVEALLHGRLGASGGGGVGPEARAELAAISEGLALVVSVTNDMTDLQKLRAGRFEVHPAPTRLRAVLESCVASVRPALRGAAADMQLVYDDAMPPLVRARRWWWWWERTAPPCARQPACHSSGIRFGLFRRIFN
jgi:signal transduction histidine kinase